MVIAVGRPRFCGHVRTHGSTFPDTGLKHSSISYILASSAVVLKPPFIRSLKMETMDIVLVAAPEISGMQSTLIGTLA